MRRVIWAFCLMLLLASPCWAALPMSESFEGTGYENSWTETVDSGNTVNEDATSVTPPTCGGSQTLNFTTGGVNPNAYTLWDNGSGSNADNRIRVYVYIASTNTSDTSSRRIVIAKGAVNTVTLFYRYLTGQRRLFMARYDGGEINSVEKTGLSDGTWYRVEMQYDSVGKVWEFRVDGVTIDSGTLNNPRTDLQRLQVGLEVSSTHNIHADLVNWSTSGAWAGAATCGGGDVNKLMLLGVG